MAALKAAFSAGVAICTLTPLPCRSFGASFAASCEASIAQAENAVKNAQLNLDYTRITAPVDGIVVARNMSPGQTST